MIDAPSNTHGQCHCGAVKFEGKGPVKGVDACHCATCRHLNGGPYMGVGFHNGITLTQSDALKWYESSAWARRGFCGECGTSLFYNLKGSAFTSVSSGCLDMPRGLTLSREYFIDEKPDFYDFSGERPRLTAAEAFASFQKLDAQKDDDND
ncbi:aldehyde-activating protein [Algimonas arctica]|uniref:Aldehyde-activating protein n=1 Tax=Algimonas arctica TaxID=1479486 RepID=A0A8J3CT61_9PROT|nr:GFA family protein [Algimonas arctica]GHA95676.1 aldehyde-activating protein [Algimonas arctica]